MAIIDGKIRPEVASLWHKYYPDYNPNRFSVYVESHVNRSSRVLEIGAGSGMGDQNRFELKGKVAKYAGIDLDKRVLENANLDEAFICDAEALPFQDESFDVVFHTKVAEHFQNPLAVMRETARVLRPGGVLLFETPNRFYYPMLVAAVTPHWFHVLYVGRFGSGRKPDDIFPTMYRLNDKRAILSITRSAGFEAEVHLLSMPPGYLRFSRLTFLLGVLYERTVERFIPALRATVVVVATYWPVTG